MIEFLTQNWTLLIFVVVFAPTYIISTHVIWWWSFKVSKTNQPLPKLYMKEYDSSNGGALGNLTLIIVAYSFAWIIILLLFVILFFLTYKTYIWFTTSTYDIGSVIPVIVLFSYLPPFLIRLFRRGFRERFHFFQTLKKK